MISYAQNREDVLLERVFKGRARGFYVDVGANHPMVDSVTRHFYDKGWTGINIEPGPIVFAHLAAQRAHDLNLNLAVSDHDGEVTFYEHPSAPGTSSLSPELDPGIQHLVTERVAHAVQARTLRTILSEHNVRDIDFMSIDVEGHERQVLLGNDFDRFRPVVLLIESTLPNSLTSIHERFEDVVLAARYRFVHFDGLNRFYLREEDADRLAHHFQLPPNVHDGYTLLDAKILGEERDACNQSLAALRETEAARVAEIASIREIAAQREAEIHRLAAEVSYHVGRLSQEEASHRATRAEANAAFEANGELRAQHEEAARQSARTIGNLQQDLHLTRQAAEAQRQEAVRVNALLTALQTEHDLKLAELELLRTESAQREADLLASEKQHKAELETLQARLASSLRDQETLQSRIAADLREIERLRALIRTDDAKIEHLSDQLNHFQHVYNEARKELDWMTAGVGRRSIQLTLPLTRFVHKLAKIAGLSGSKS